MENDEFDSVNARLVAHGWPEISFDFYEQYEEELYNMFVNDIIPAVCDDDKILNAIGIYFDINEKYANMVKYYHMAINKGNDDAMYNLGHYHLRITKNRTKIIKYLDMAVAKGNVRAMIDLGRYHMDVTKKYDEMIKYFNMAIDKGHILAMTNLGSYHMDITRNYDEMIKYFDMAIDKGEVCAMNNLGVYYCDVKHNLDLAYKYLIRACKYNYDAAINNVNRIYIDDHIDILIKYLLEFDVKPSIMKKNNVIINKFYEQAELNKRLTTEIIELREQITELRLRPPQLGGPEYEEAKKDFESLQLACST